jgi:hypothetical protein
MHVTDVCQMTITGQIKEHANQAATWGGTVLGAVHLTASTLFSLLSF